MGCGSSKAVLIRPSVSQTVEPSVARQTVPTRMSNPIVFLEGSDSTTRPAPLGQRETTSIQAVELTPMIPRSTETRKSSEEVASSDKDIRSDPLPILPPIRKSVPTISETNTSGSNSDQNTVAETPALPESRSLQEPITESTVSTLHAPVDSSTDPNMQLSRLVDLVRGHQKDDQHPESRYAVLIQKWYRRHQASVKFQAERNWAIFQAHEYDDELSMLHLCRFFDRLSVLARANSTAPSSFPSFAPRTMMQVRQRKSAFLLAHVEATDALKHSPPMSPLDVTLAQVLIESTSQNRLVEAELIIAIISAACDVLWTQPNIRKFDTSSTGKVTVVGDLHGNLVDLLIIFQKNGIPSPSNAYVFNGDFVDRGEQSVEIMTLLLLFQLIYPNHVFLNRGNHEDYLMSKRYGFEKEILKKYPEHGTRLVKAFTFSFTLIPLATIISDQIFVVHAGICEGLDLQLINLIDRSLLSSILQIAQSLVYDDAIELDDELKVRHFVTNMVWSDPFNQKGSSFNKARGGGVLFGRDVTERFMDANNFCLVVRSHQCVQNGYEFTHDRNVLTLFSASNYYSEGSNSGAYVTFDAQLQAKLTTYSSSTTTLLKNMSIRSKVSAVEQSALTQLSELMTKHQSTLLTAFRRHDPDNTGTILLDEWVSAMHQLSVGFIPWRSLATRFIDLDSNGRVIYNTCFQKYQGHTFPEVPSTQLSKAVNAHLSELEFIFRFIDADHSGDITKEELTQACALLNQQEPNDEKFTQEIIEGLNASLDANKDGTIHFSEFLQSFRVYHTRKSIDHST